METVCSRFMPAAQSPVGLFSLGKHISVKPSASPWASFPENVSGRLRTEEGGRGVGWVGGWGSGNPVSLVKQVIHSNLRKSIGAGSQARRTQLLILGTHRLSSQEVAKQKG